MSQTTNSKQKVDYAVGMGDLVASTENKLSDKMTQLLSLTEEAKYAAMDKVYNAFANAANGFVDLCSNNVKACRQILEILSKDKAIGEDFTASVKKAIGVLDAVQSRKDSYPELLNQVRDGEETWDSKKQGAVQAVLVDIIGVRKAYILALSGISKGMEDPRFKDIVMGIGKKNEEYTNSWVRMYNSVREELAALGIYIDKEFNDAESAASAIGNVGAVSGSVNIVGAEV